MLYLFGVCLFGLVVYGVAKADTIGPGTGCSSCFGSSYTLTDATTNTPGVFDVFLTVDTTGSTLSSTKDFLNAVSIKLVSQRSAITDVTLLSSPYSYGITENGGLNSSGCSGVGGGYFCNSYTGAGSGLAIGRSGDVYHFEWQLTLASASDLLTGDDAISIKALYVDAITGKSAGITSEGIDPTPATPSVPEPSSFLLLGTGLAGFVGASIWRRRERLSRVSVGAITA
jgi:hypothetical protein